MAVLRGPYPRAAAAEKLRAKTCDGRFRAVSDEPETNNTESLVTSSFDMLLESTQLICDLIYRASCRLPA